jgi:hypothetical protein
MAAPTSGGVLDQLEDVLSRAQNTGPQHIPVISQLESFYSAIGLGEGPLAPTGRGVVTFLGVLALQKAISPAAIYDAAGNARPWRFNPVRKIQQAVDEDDEEAQQGSGNSDHEATSLPWWMIPGAAGLAVMWFL